MHKKDKGQTQATQWTKKTNDKHRRYCFACACPLSFLSILLPVFVLCIFCPLYGLCLSFFFFVYCMACVCPLMKTTNTGNQMDKKDKGQAQAIQCTKIDKEQTQAIQ
jgi:hypothetical protein